MDKNEHLEAFLQIVNDIFENLKKDGRLEEVLDDFQRKKNFPTPPESPGEE